MVRSLSQKRALKMSMPRLICQPRSMKTFDVDVATMVAAVDIAGAAEVMETDAAVATAAETVVAATDVTEADAGVTRIINTV